MARVDLSSLEWYDLIFNGKNRAYGACKMREGSPCRHSITVILMIVVVLIGFSIPTLVKMMTPKQKEMMAEMIILLQLEGSEVEQEGMKRVEPAAPPPPTLRNPIKFTAPVIKRDEGVRDGDEIKSRTELTETKVAISIADVKGSDEANGRGIANLKQMMTQAPEEEEKVFDMVEQMPTFPSRTSELMKYIVDYLKYPTIAQENGVEGRMICQLVVSSGGRARGAKVMKTLDPYRDKEAIRVIMSMPKWIPEEQNGKAVSVKCTTPIIFRLR